MLYWLRGGRVRKPGTRIRLGTRASWVAKSRHIYILGRKRKWERAHIIAMRILGRFWEAYGMVGAVGLPSTEANGHAKNSSITCLANAASKWSSIAVMFLILGGAGVASMPYPYVHLVSLSYFE